MIKDGKAGWINGQGMPKEVIELCMGRNPTKDELRRIDNLILNGDGRVVYRNHPLYKGLPHDWTPVRAGHRPCKGYQYGIYL